MFDEEARIEVALDHTRTEVVDAPRTSSTSTDSSNDFIEVKTSLVTVNQTFANTNLHNYTIKNR